MIKERNSMVKVREVNIALPGDDDLFLKERPIETLNRELAAMKLSPRRVAELIEKDAELVENALAEKIYCPEELLFLMLNLVGYELVAVPDELQWRKSGGHHYYRERCVYCSGNTYDIAMYGPKVCDNSPS